MFGRKRRVEDREKETHHFLVEDVEENEEFDGSQVEFELANELRFLGTYADGDRKAY